MCNRIWLLETIFDKNKLPSWWQLLATWHLPLLPTFYLFTCFSVIRVHTRIKKYSNVSCHSLYKSFNLRMSPVCLSPPFLCKGTLTSTISCSLVFGNKDFYFSFLTLHFKHSIRITYTLLCHLKINKCGIYTL